jgi:hypothetical protein
MAALLVNLLEQRFLHLERGAACKIFKRELTLKRM